MGRERGATHPELDSALGRVDAHRFYDREGATRTLCFGWSLDWAYDGGSTPAWA